ncbi:hypothetical protein GOP47_0005693 [Adiantum capillus-veneris]|uniref:Uncharacterized protein n=1 Tax=Adiantum capillus-veneris TaxID=13818 RepID=A0A9D4ZLT9_ADICA|nr:hypothetical protein GOP47_0005693 [Adiantum capillus-veneris]
MLVMSTRGCPPWSFCSQPSSCLASSPFLPVYSLGCFLSWHILPPRSFWLPILLLEPSAFNSPSQRDHAWVLPPASTSHTWSARSLSTPRDQHPFKTHSHPDLDHKQPVGTCFSALGLAFFTKMAALHTTHAEIAPLPSLPHM